MVPLAIDILSPVLSSYIFFYYPAIRDNLAAALSNFQDILGSPCIFLGVWFPLVYDSSESNQHNLASVEDLRLPLNSTPNQRFKILMLVDLQFSYLLPLLLLN
jgi:hypothetical protein